MYRSVCFFRIPYLAEMEAAPDVEPCPLLDTERSRLTKLPHDT